MFRETLCKTVTLNHRGGVKESEGTSADANKLCVVRMHFQENLSQILSQINQQKPVETDLTCINKYTKLVTLSYKCMYMYMQPPIKYVTCKAEMIYENIMLRL